MQTTNFLDYTKLTFSEIVEQITTKLKADPDMENFRESTIAQMLIEIFSATTDLTNYYIERRAEESYLDTAKLKSSVILLAKQLGYIVTRPIPAQSSIKIILKGPIASNIVATDSMELPLQTELTYDGKPFLLKNTYKYIFTTDDITNGQGNSNWSKELIYTYANPTTSNIELLSEEDVTARSISISALDTIDIFQGGKKLKTILGATNPFVGKKFQTYKINDKTFSNYFGGEDLGNDDGIWRDSSLNTTSVRISGSSTTVTCQINRRSLIDYDNLNSFSSISANADDIVLVKTTPDENIELQFGDGNYANIGAKTNSENIIIEYLSTLGANANEIGVIGKKITYSNTILVNNDITKDFTANVKMYLNSNIKNGADMESIDSIRLNSPGIYYALDRVITSNDYESFLKSLTSPINIKNAIAWGEQEESAKNDYTPIEKLFNIVLFTVMGSLYVKSGDTWYSKVNTSGSGELDIDSAILDNEDTIYNEPENSYFNIFIKNTDSINFGATTSSSISAVTDKLKNKSQLTIRNVYVSPFIRDFEVTGNIFINRLFDSVKMQKDITNKVYEFLDDNADFNKDIYLSNIIDVVENFKGVNHTNITLSPSLLSSGADKLNMDTLADFTNIVTGTSYSGCNSKIQSHFQSGFSKWKTNDIIPYPYSGTWTNLMNQTSYAKITEYNFSAKLIKYIYDYIQTDSTSCGGIPISGFENTEYFTTMIYRLRNGILHLIKNNMMLGTDIKNYSVNNEIVKINFKPIVTYIS